MTDQQAQQNSVSQAQPVLATIDTSFEASKPGKEKLFRLTERDNFSNIRNELTIPQWLHYRQMLVKSVNLTQIVQTCEPHLILLCVFHSLRVHSKQDAGDN